MVDWACPFEDMVDKADADVEVVGEIGFGRNLDSEDSSLDDRNSLNYRVVYLDFGPFEASGSFVACCNHILDWEARKTEAA